MHNIHYYQLKRYLLSNKAVEGSGVLLYMYEFVYQEEKNQSIYLCPFAKLPNMARQLQPMDRLFIPPVPLGEISLAAYYLEAVLRSVVCYRAPPRSA